MVLHQYEPTEAFIWFRSWPRVAANSRTTASLAKQYAVGIL